MQILRPRPRPTKLGILEAVQEAESSEAPHGSLISSPGSNPQLWQNHTDFCRKQTDGQVRRALKVGRFFSLCHFVLDARCNQFSRREVSGGYLRQRSAGVVTQNFFTVMETLTAGKLDDMDQYPSAVVHALHKSKELCKFGFSSRAIFAVAGGGRCHYDGLHPSTARLQ